MAGGSEPTTELLRLKLADPARPQAIAGRGDHDLNPDLAPPQPLRPAAVLIAVLDRPGDAAVLMTRRTETLKEHAGQVSFPGGRLEPHDEGPVAAALREAQEEIGLDPARVEVIGRLDTYVTRTGFSVVPVVGLVAPPVTLMADPTEVAEIFELPLARILGARGPRREVRQLNGRERSFYALVHGPHYIWGATAGMLVNFRNIVLAP